MERRWNSLQVPAYHAYPHARGQMPLTMHQFNVKSQDDEECACPLPPAPLTDAAAAGLEEEEEEGRPCSSTLAPHWPST
ncbi:hypothetical protein INR49_023049 [Caranx melampygus]|nr:hypothetical protein INR49_023049 [Caranx melampygus]